MLWLHLAQPLGKFGLLSIISSGHIGLYLISRFQFLKPTTFETQIYMRTLLAFRPAFFLDVH